VLVSRRIYDTAAQRLAAFERGARLVQWRSSDERPEDAPRA